MTVTIYHNPKCSTSRKVLELLRQKGIEPEIVEYLKTPPGRQRLEEIVRLTGEPVRNLLRERGTPYAELGLGDAKWSDEELILPASCWGLPAEENTR